MTLKAVPPPEEEPEGPVLPAIRLPELDELVEPTEPADPIVAEFGELPKPTGWRAIHPAAWIVGGLVISWTILFGSLGVQNQANFGTWSYDMG
ncbi:MAG: hypothetical protein WCO88_12760, partial [Actinomycetota bacterium]